MMNYIAFDLSCEVSAACVMDKNGKTLSESLLVTTAQGFKSVISGVARPRTIVFEECCQAAWVYSVVEPISDDVIVCNPAEARQLAGKNRNDKIDASNLGHLARTGLLSRVFHGGKEFQELRVALRLYQRLTRDSTSLKNRLRAVFRSQGVRASRSVYLQAGREALIEKLPLESQRLRVALIGEHLKQVTELRKRAKVNLVSLAKKQAMFKWLMRMDGMGPILVSIFIAEVGTPSRFRTRAQLWSYSGLSIVTDETAQYAHNEGKGFHLKRDWVNTKGLTNKYNRSLKYLFKDIAKRLSKTKWKHEYERLLKSGVSAENARTTLARKAASVALHLAKTGEEYDISKVFRCQQIS